MYGLWLGLAWAVYTATKASETSLTGLWTKNAVRRQLAEGVRSQGSNLWPHVGIADLHQGTQGPIGQGWSSRSPPILSCRANGSARLWTIPGGRCSTSAR